MDSTTLAVIVVVIVIILVVVLLTIRTTENANNARRGLGDTIDGHIDDESIHFTQDSIVHNATQLRGRDISRAIPNANEVLCFDGNEWTPTPGVKTVNGAGPDEDGNIDLGLLSFDANATSIQGTPVDPTAPGTDQVLCYDGSEWTPSDVVKSVNGLVGDVVLSGGGLSIDATEIQGVPVNPAAPAVGETLCFTGSEYEPTPTVKDVEGVEPVAGSLDLEAPNGTMSFSAGPPGTLNIEANNSLGIWNADRLQGNSVSGAVPAADEGLVWDGAQWVPGEVVRTIDGVGSVGGDVDLLSTNGTMTFAPGAPGQLLVDANKDTAQWNADRIEGEAVSNTPPVANEGLVYNGSEWVPSSVVRTVSGVSPDAAGDVFLDGTVEAHATHLQAEGVSTLSPSTDQVLCFNGSEWAPSDAVKSVNGQTGDVDLETGGLDINATQIQGNDVAPGTPSAGDALCWNGTTWTGVAAVKDIEGVTPVGGSLDLATTNGTMTFGSGGAGVINIDADKDTAQWNADRLQGSNIDNVSTNPGDQKALLAWNNTAGGWRDKVVDTASSGGVSANSGSMTINNGVAIWNAANAQGFPIATTAPSGTAQALMWNGASWEPRTTMQSLEGVSPDGLGNVDLGTTNSSMTFSPGGPSVLNIDANTTSPIWNANAIQSEPVSAVSPSTGQALVYDGSEWVPSTPSGGLPIGAIIPFSGVTVPTDWFECNGQEISRTTYLTLFGTIGTSYGSGNGTTTFNVPDFQGRVPIGQDTGDTDFDVVGESGGAKTVTLAVANLPSHSHSFTATTSNVGNHSHGTGNYSTNSAGDHEHDDGNLVTASAGTHSHDFDLRRGNAGSGDNRFGTTNLGGADFDTSVETDDAGSHAHNVTGDTGTAGSHSHNVTGNSGGSGAHGHNISGNTDDTGSGTALNVMNPYLVVKYIIKAL